MTRNPTIRRLLASGLLAVTLVAGACGGSDDDGDTAGGDATTDTTAAETESGGEDAASGDAVQIVDFNYKPANLQVKAGTTVTFTNEDGFAHTATAKDKSFDSGNLEEGGTFEHTFDEAGTFDYICAIHNSMTGKVTVS